MKSRPYPSQLPLGLPNVLSEASVVNAGVGLLKLTPGHISG